MRDIGFMCGFVLSLLGAVSSQAADPLAAKLDLVEFTEAPLVDAIEYLRARSKELDPTGRGANIVIDPSVDLDRNVTLALGDVSIGVALLCLVEQCSLDYKREAHAFLIVREGAGVIAREELRQNGPVASPQADRARALQLDRIEFSEAPVSDVLSYLSAMSREGGGAGLNLVVDHRVDPTIPVSLRLQNVAASFVLGRIASTTGIEIRAVPWAILVEPPGEEWRRQQRVAEWARQSRSNSRTPSSRNYIASSGNTYVNKDPRSPAHPDYVHSTEPDVSKRSNALNNVYKWVNGRWTFVRYGSAGTKSLLDGGTGSLKIGSLDGSE